MLINYAKIVIEYDLCPNVPFFHSNEWIFALLIAVSCK